ncbi:MAG: hypothetical protein N2578_01430, partial [Bdellovibrionaceae bacterium]|nr:hypothetical protein [Pseudobdellovibrionaceae bacterium]
TDAAGNPLVSPELREVVPAKAEYVQLDWSNNRLPIVHSPLAYYDSAGCFAPNTEMVTDLDQRLEEGVLSFSVLSTVTITSSECVTSYGGVGDYRWDNNMQLIQNLKERISFRAYDRS